MPQSSGGTLPGATVEELLAMGRRLSPDLQAMALDAEAATARAQGAGALPDPMFEAELLDVIGTRRSDGVEPERIERVDYRLSQVFPLWGKRGLREAAARAEADGAQARSRSAALDLDARIKTVFARAYGYRRALELTRDLLGSVKTMGEIAQRRYAQGAGGQEDAIRAQVEAGRMEAELVRLGADRRVLTARMNGLLDRAPGEPLADPQRLRPLPEPAVLADLIGRARAANPELAASDAEVEAALSGRRLAERAWYPDPGVRLSLVTVNPRQGSPRFEGYEAMLFFEVPLQWGVRQAEVREATAALGAARMRRQAADAGLRGAIEEAALGLEAARDGARILETKTIPDGETALQSAVQAYRQGRMGLTTVLEAEQGVLRTRLEHLELLIEQQTMLAEIERLIGGDL
jgi:outer membrane protein TolC